MPLHEGKYQGLCGNCFTTCSLFEDPLKQKIFCLWHFQDGLSELSGGTEGYCFARVRTARVMPVW